MHPFLAVAPIAVLLGLMLAAQWSAARAGIASLAVALLFAWWVFDFTPVGVDSRSLGTVGSFAEAGFSAATILWIIFGALCVYHLQLRSEAMNIIRDSLGGLSRDPVVITLVVAWFFGLFMEGAAGFGTPLALAAPLLVSLGCRPLEAVVLAMVGHSAGVSFGAVGTPIAAQVVATGYDAQELARATGLYHSLLGSVLVAYLVWRASSAFEGKEGLHLRQWGWAALAAILFLVPFWILATWVGPELPTLGGALLGAAVFVAALALMARFTGGGADRVPSHGHSLAPILRSAAPYLALVTLVGATRLISPLRDTLQGQTWSWTLFGEFTGSIQPLYHPGTLLFLSFLVGAMLQHARWHDVGHAMAASARRLVPVGLALAAILGMARLMVNTGMIDVLATEAAAAMGGAWPWVAPGVGALGSLVTGSATTSNILFTDLQQRVAEALDLPVLPLLAAQGFGAAAGNLISPHNIIAGCATVGLVGQESAVLRRTLAICLLYAMLGGLVAFLLTRAAIAAGIP